MPRHLVVPGLPTRRAATMTRASAPLPLLSAPPQISPSALPDLRLALPVAPLIATPAPYGHAVAPRPRAVLPSIGPDPDAVTDVGMAVRVPAFVVVTVALGLGAHAAAGGGPPSLSSALLIALLVGIAGRQFALREQSLLRLAALVWSVQAGIHFVLLSGHRHGAGSHVLAVRLGVHQLHVPTVLPAQAVLVPPPVEGLPADLAGQAAPAVVSAAEFGSSLLMLALHALAGLVVAAWLRRGEAVVFRAARRILPRLLPCRPVPVRRSAQPTLPVCTAPCLPHGRRLIRLTTPRRGPPALHCC
ncbi:MAG TPA: hypothetical protein VFP72_19125 [Kineosporiaceae bacterium]|nr:hypothetical protein [Kineosporiaceae bacterium]